MYLNIKALSCTPESNMTLKVTYASIEKRKLFTEVPPKILDMLYQICHMIFTSQSLARGMELPNWPRIILQYRIVSQRSATVITIKDKAGTRDRGGRKGKQARIRLLALQNHSLQIISTLPRSQLGV